LISSISERTIPKAGPISQLDFSACSTIKLLCALTVATAHGFPIWLPTWRNLCNLECKESKKLRCHRMYKVITKSLDIPQPFTLQTHFPWRISNRSGFRCQSPVTHNACYPSSCGWNYRHNRDNSFQALGRRYCTCKEFCIFIDCSWYL
jgi:hypothetical protein